MDHSAEEDRDLFIGAISMLEYHGASFDTLVRIKQVFQCFMETTHEEDLY